jgi:predicted CoA-binding protein
MNTKKTLVMGVSDNPGRYSYLAVQRLLQYNQPVVALGKKKVEVLGISVETEKLPFENIDTVTLYLNPANQVEYYDYILSLKPKRVIFNPGTENPELYKLLDENNINYEIACTLVMLATNQF